MMPAIGASGAHAPIRRVYCVPITYANVDHRTRLAPGAAAALVQHDEIERLEAATAVFEEIMTASDERIRVYPVSSSG